jgi:thiamine-phosphate pyrophosphorylase|tara:strand:- start:345 stop:953 length:609 start_codon:yes stop_codon:yes gene_type:complete
LKRYIYLISPQKIRGFKFYKELNNILKTNKIKYFQLRLKKISTHNLLKISKKIKKITRKNNVKFLINDEPLIAKMIGADGCHIGQKDMDFVKTREILRKNKIIGVTCHNSKKLALKAKKHGANYIAFGSFFKSSTKKSASRADLRILRWAKKKINMPIVAIGGLNNSNYKKVLSNGADFIACSSYVWNNKKLDPISAIKKFK